LEVTHLAKLPPEGRRCPTLLDLGIAYPDGRVQAAADVARREVGGPDHATLVARRAELERDLEVPDGWPLLYREQLARLERMALAAGDVPFLEAIQRGRTLLDDCSEQTELWWVENGKTAGQLAAVEALLAERA
jgi:hypothetical protein